MSPILGVVNAGDVTVIGVAQDIYRAAGQASFVVNVLMQKNFNTSSFFLSSLTSNIATGNVDGVFQAINLVSSVINSKNCSAAPNCSALNRQSCLQTVNTCSSCLDTYIGISGDSNIRCLEESSPIGKIGSVCKQDAECLYNQCDSGICVAPQKSCQSSVPGAVCSGHGLCRKLDSSGNTMQSCTIFNQECSTSCLCRPGHGGVDCSLHGAALKDRAQLRVKMCSALTHVISVSQKSPQLFDTIASTLLSAYNKDEITAAAELVKCSSVVRFLGTLASRGFLKSTLPATQQIYAELSSQFVGTRVSSNSSHSNRFANDVSNAVLGLTEGVLKGMAMGQNPVSLVTSNIRATLINELTSSVSNMHFSPPLTAAELKDGLPQSKIIIPGDGVSGCTQGNPYAQISTLLFGTNPHADSKAVKASLLQFSSMGLPSSIKNVTSSSRNILQSSNGNLRNESLVAYYVILQFSSKQQFDLSTRASLQNNKNRSLPECALYNSSVAKYVSCGNCNVSSYTNFNVTFGCYDINQLCPSATQVARQLINIDSEYDRLTDISEEDVSKEIEEEEEEWNWDHDMVTQASRDLKQSVNASNASDDYIPSTDDGPANPEDHFTNKRGATVREFGTVLGAIVDEVSSVLSVNPFAINLSSAKPVLALVGCICGSIILGLLFFLRWDKMDRHKAVYLLDEKEREIKIQIADDLQRGGNGVTSMKSHSLLKRSDNSERFLKIFNTSIDTLVSSRNSNSNSNNSSSRSINIDFQKSSRSLADVLDHDPENSSLVTNVLIAKFSNEVLPQAYTLNEGALKFKGGKYKLSSSTWTDALYTIRHKHYMTAMFYRPSLYVSRTLRFVELCRKMLLFLFIDTVLFGIFFPSDATCTTYTRRAECIAIPSPVSKTER